MFKILSKEIERMIDDGERVPESFWKRLYFYNEKSRNCRIGLVLGFAGGIGLAYFWFLYQTYKLWTQT